MRRKGDKCIRVRAHRGIAAAVFLLALLMQAISPYLPMPAMGGMTSWEQMSAALEPCPTHQTDAGHKMPAKQPQDHRCTVCSVMQQAGSAVAGGWVILACGLAYLQVGVDATHDIQRAGLAAAAFSSRAPPRAV